MMTLTLLREYAEEEENFEYVNENTIIEEELE